MFVTLAIGRCSLAPAEDLATIDVTPAARRSGMTTPSAPAASAVRRTAPRLCGSSTPSSTTISECCPRFASMTSSRSLYCFADVTATTPWCAPFPAMRSNSGRGRKRTAIPTLRHSSTTRCSRKSCRSLATPTHWNARPRAFKASATALMP